ncbi:MAG: hypothetical protein JWR84_2015, partial [Caulobacter sp.]|nr:hypothetical protein [Caulobacter sp.]
RRSMTTIIALEKVLERHLRGDSIGAMDALSTVFGRFGAEAPSRHALVVAQVLAADLNIELDHKAEAYQACAFALSLLDEPDSADAFNEIDSNYLKFRCKWTLSQTTTFVDSRAFELAAAIPVTSTTLDIRRTSLLLRKLFPMRPETGAQVDAYFEANRAA